MKLIFNLDTQKKEAIFKQIAEHYKTSVKRDRADLFVMVKPKLLIASKNVKTKELVYVWGASNSDLRFLTTLLGEPVEIKKEKPSPDEFATELLMIPSVEQKTKDEIIELLQLEKNDWDRYKNLISLLARRKKEEKFIKAKSILDTLS